TIRYLQEPFASPDIKLSTEKDPTIFSITLFKLLTPFRNFNATLALPAGRILGAIPPYGKSLLTIVHNIQHQRWQSNRLREQARSHIGLLVSARLGYC
ncbi:hypothetical protein, partial [Pseudomonas mandelii]|uniref:hypothetical protein n=1 Tax=Pseudomonas mandelii TaxID=75612 RepID=UPI003CFC9A6D